MLRSSLSSKYEFKRKLQHFHSSRWTRPRHSVSLLYVKCLFLQIPHLSIFAIWKRLIDVQPFMSKHNSEHYVLFLSPLLFTPRHQCVIIKLQINHSVKYVTMNRMCILMHIYTSQWTHTRHIFRFSRSGKREVDVNHNE